MKNLNILKIYGDQKIKTFPIISTADLIYYILFKRIKWISFLDYFNYNKEDAIEILKLKYNFKPYPYKHYESVFTRFYQGYILPKKFKVDKRKLHFSTLIISKQMHRDDALKQLMSDHAYLSEEALQNDKEYYETVNEIHRILKPNGLVFITEPGRYKFFRFIEYVFYLFSFISTFAKTFSDMMEEEKKEQHYFLLNHHKIKNYLKKKKFKILKNKYFLSSWIYVGLKKT